MLSEASAPSPKPRIAEVTVPELFASLKAGARDFRAAPLFGVAFSSFYVIAGILLVWVGAGTFLWTLAFALGFPLVAPFAAVGLYEVSRRIEADEPLLWQSILGVVWQERARQLPWAGVILTLIFLFWSFFAHMAFAMFMGLTALTNVSTSWSLYMSPEGVAMMLLQVVVGGAVAFLTFGLTAVSLPLMVDKEIDFVSAMVLSLRTVARNRAVMLLWAAVIAISVMIAMIPLFLGLLIVLPVLGHATWHLYRRALSHPL